MQGENLTYAQAVEFSLGDNENIAIVTRDGFEPKRFFAGQPGEAELFLLPGQDDDSYALSEDDKAATDWRVAEGDELEAAGIEFELGEDEFGQEAPFTVDKPVPAETPAPEAPTDGGHPLTA